ncbi:MAG: hypothetical protein HZB55_01965 [Deltaproteobacteria bacterium]|nr:hypothetical protein [Deltaproteobacteria bacterium]
MAEETTTKPTQIASSLKPERVFRPGRKGTWHLVAHREYGVIFSHCGLRVMAKDCSFPETDVLIRDLCGTCGRVAKTEIGRERPGAENG